MSSEAIANQVIESLRRGTPPQKGIELYSVGNEKLIEGIIKHHLDGIKDFGRCRFISGSWGAGKTHFFRQLREVAFKKNFLVSNIELGLNSASLNKFETIFSEIIRHIATPSQYSGNDPLEIAPFGTIIRESMIYLSTQSREKLDIISHDQYKNAVEKLMSNQSIENDFKIMIKKYWETFLTEDADLSIIEQARGEILQWFCGEGTIGGFRKKYGVNTIVKRENAQLMLQSLAGFILLSGYNGLVILFDETEQSYSLMRKSSLKDAHTNLRSLIDNIAEKNRGIFLIYATTPDFYTDPKHGIVIYGALSGRIGKPEPNRQPRALDTIWNFDAVETKLENYQTAASKIREIYLVAYPDGKSTIPTKPIVEKRVSELFDLHSPLSSVRFWRLLVTALITDFDDHLEGEIKSSEKLYDDIMDRIRED